jgi:hypothetical protein
MVGPPNWADDSLSGSKPKPRAKIARRASKPTKRMARIMGCEFVPKEAEQSCPMCCGPVDEDGMTLASGEA